MINSLRLINFKCFKDQTIPIKPLTLLTGKNNTGKSTVLQALMLLRHSYQKNKLDTLLLNGKEIYLGVAQDVLYEQAEDGDSTFIGFELGFDFGAKREWSFKYYSPQQDRLLGWDIGETEETVYKSALFTNDFHYIRAERIGIRAEYPMSEYHIQNNDLGILGEYTVHFLDTYGNQEIPNKELSHPQAKSLSLKDQVEAWMGEVSPGIHIKTTANPSAQSIVLEYSFNGSANYSPFNASYGVTHSLPIFVAVLSAVPGSLVLIENPESGLHGKAQSAMGRFLAIASNWGWGIQTIIETNSNHILNAIRVATHQWQISPDDIQINYFQKDQDNQIKLIAPKIDRNGRINKWPDGFFDQWDQNLMVLLEPASKTKP